MATSKARGAAVGLSAMSSEEGCGWAMPPMATKIRMVHFIRGGYHFGFERLCKKSDDRKR
jgi:hypothetical protein